MAKHHKIMINRPMLEAIKNGLPAFRSKKGRLVCPLCDRELGEHSSITVNDAGTKVTSCNWVEEW